MATMSPRSGQGPFAHLREASGANSPTPPSSILSSKHASMRSQSQIEPSKPLRSQYPRDGTRNHVECIMVAAFDIDKGPIVEYQYPAPISSDESKLAELMLPDQTHLRQQDWTIFFLHKESDESGDEATPRRPSENGLFATESSEDWQKVGREDNDSEYGPEEGPPLIYVLNLVNTKQDSTKKRGADVKAMAICTRHSFLHIYKPLLLLALEEYYKSPFPETLDALYNAVNNMDLSLLPKLTVYESQILCSTEVKDMFAERFEQMVQQRMLQDLAEGVKSSSGLQEDDQAKSYIDLPTKPSVASLANRPQLQQHLKYGLPRDTHEFETKVVYNGIPIPIKVPVAILPETVGDFSLIKLIQTFSIPHAKDPQAFPIHAHLTTCGPLTHPIIVLMNAMLTQKRVMFLGHNRPSGEVADAVLAACALASGGVLKGFTRHAFPYTDLTKIDELLNVPGFIAGVTNPAFANHHEWWDILCDIPTGRIKISSKIESPATTEGALSFQSIFGTHPSSATSVSDPTGDIAFMDDILRSISARHGENVIRARWRDWIMKFTRISAAFEELVYGASALQSAQGSGEGVLPGHGYVWSEDNLKMRELWGNVSRIEAWRNTRSYNSLKQDLAKALSYRPVKQIDIQHHHDRLRALKLSQADSAAIYLAFNQLITTPRAVTQLLSVTPESHAGIFYLSLGLFHPRKDVRHATVEILSRVEHHEVGHHFWSGLSRFAKLAYFRILREREGANGVENGV